MCLSRVTSARAGGEGVGVRMLGTPPCAHKDSHRGVADFVQFQKKKKKTHHFLEQDSHPNFLDRLNLDEFRLGIVLPAFFVLPDLPREPHLLWQQPKVATNL